MSGVLDPRGGAAPRPRVSLFGRASKPAPGAPPPPKQPPRKPRRSVLSGVSGFLTFVLLGALATAGALGWLLMESRSPGPLAADKVVLIVREDDGGSIADQLERAGVIDSADVVQHSDPARRHPRRAETRRIRVQGGRQHD